MIFDKDFWDVTWKRPYGNYNSHHEAVWRAVLPFVKGKVVDLGCGPCVIYKGKDIDLTGVDFSDSAIQEAKKNYPQGKYVVSKAQDTELPEKSFDTVIMLGLLDYFDDWSIILNEAERICKDDGHIVATLLDGFQNHNWKTYKHLTSNWYIYEHK